MVVSKHTARHIGLAVAPFAGATAFLMSGAGYNVWVFNAGLLLVIAMMALADSMWERAYALPVLVIVLTIGVVISPAARLAEFVRRPELAPHDGWVAVVVFYAVIAMLAWLFVEVVLWFRHREHHTPETEKPAAKTKAGKPSLSALPIAKRDDTGTRYLFPAGPGRHVIFVGATGSGKGGAFWAYIAALAPYQADGLVELVGIDPKGGQELRFAERLFTTLLWQNPEVETQKEFAERVADYLEAVADEVLMKAKRLGDAKLRKHVPTPGDPQKVIVIDELVLLISLSEREAAKRIVNALNVILTQGRAPGYTVIGAAQSAKVEVLDEVINNFVIRVCLRMNNARQVDTALGYGMRTEHNADAHEIPKDKPGTAYVYDDDDNTCVRIRFNHFTDEALAELEAKYAVDGRVADIADTAEIPVVRVGDYGDAVEVGHDEQTAEPVVSLPERIAAVWPEKRKTGRGVVLVTDVAELVGRPVGELEVLLAAEGIEPVGEVSKPLDRSNKTAARGCYRWADFAGYAVTGHVTVTRGG